MYIKIIMPYTSDDDRVVNFTHYFALFRFSKDERFIFAYSILLDSVLLLFFLLNLNVLYDFFSKTQVLATFTS